MSIKEYLKKYDKQILIACILTVLALQLIFNSTKTEPIELERVNLLEIDTIIPAGHSLFPLELTNQESILSMIGDFGVIDLYRFIPNNKKILIAENLKIFKSRKNENLLYALVFDDQTHKFISLDQKMFAVIKNRKSPAIKMPMSPKKTKRVITIGVE